jgi:hypothetical protein
MTDLSPAAQAVLTALTQQEYGLDPADIPNEAGRMACVAAAALRAAADQVLAAQWEGRIEADTAHSLGINWSRDALHAIATELEGAND